jgi:predicted permease
MSGIMQDVRFAIRLWARQPGFTLSAFFILSLGIGANLTIFGVVNSLLLRPPRIQEPERLAFIYSTDRADALVSQQPFSYPDYRDLKDGNRSFSGLLAYALTPMGLGRGKDSAMVFGEVVSGNYFDVLGAAPALGRLLLAEDDAPGSSPVAVLSHQAHRARFAGDPGIIGRSILVNGNVFTVVGVTRPGFTGLLRGLAPEIWVPAAAQPATRPSPGNLLESRDTRWLWVAGRLKPGVTLEQARAELGTVAGGWERSFPESHRGRGITALPAREVKFHPAADTAVYAASGFVMAVVGFVLLIACANVGGLLLARNSARRKEIAVRLALGAGRYRLVRQLLTESLMLALLGGAGGLLLGVWIQGILEKALLGIRLPIPVRIVLDLSPDLRVLTFLLVTSTLTAVLCGLVPALQASRPDLVVALRDESGAAPAGALKSKLRSALVVFQVALSLVLLAGAGLSLRSLRNARFIDPGFSAASLGSASFDLSLRGYDEARGRDFYRRLLEQVRAVPGVEAATVATQLPLSFQIQMTEVSPAGDPAGSDAARMVDAAIVGPDYFTTMGIPIVRGRQFDEKDSDAAPRVAIINETLARQLWPGENPLGKRLGSQRAGAPEMEIVGVARDAKYRTLGEPPLPFVYTPLLQEYESRGVLIVRSPADPRRLLGEMRAAIRGLDPDLPVFNAQPVSESIAVSLLLPQTGAALFGSFGLVGLLLSAAGLYGLMAYLVSLRRREIGIRMALGATRGNVFREVARQGLMRAGVGIALGAPLSLAVNRGLNAVLYGLTSTDLATLAGIALLLAGVSLLACYLPARRAARLDPMAALRHD